MAYAHFVVLLVRMKREIIEKFWELERGARRLSLGINEDRSKYMATRRNYVGMSDLDVCLWNLNTWGQ